MMKSKPDNDVIMNDKFIRVNAAGQRCTFLHKNKEYALNFFLLGKGEGEFCAL